MALSLAGCDDAPPAPPAPPAPTTSKETELLAAINKVWKEKFDAGAGGFTHEQLTLNQDAVDLLSAYGHILENANETTHQMTTDDGEIFSNGYLAFAKKMQKYGGEDSVVGYAGIFHRTTDDVVTLEYKYSCEDAAVRAFVEKLLDSTPNSRKAEFISIYCPVVQNVTYMTAIVFWNKTATP